MNRVADLIATRPDPAIRVRYPATGGPRLKRLAT
jgi:hypothetical protein